MYDDPLPVYNTWFESSTICILIDAVFTATESAIIYAWYIPPHRFFNHAETYDAPILVTVSVCMLNNTCRSVPHHDDTEFTILIENCFRVPSFVVQLNPYLVQVAIALTCSI